MKDLPIHETAPSVEAAASVALNRGPVGPAALPGPAGPDWVPPGVENPLRGEKGPPDYAEPAGTVKWPPPIGCYLCGHSFPFDKRINWRGHWVCPGCYQKGTGWLRQEGKEQEPTVFTKILEEDQALLKEDLNAAVDKARQSIKFVMCEAPSPLDGTPCMLVYGHPGDHFAQGVGWSRQPEVTADSILHQAAATVEQRGKDYNSPGGERSMRATVEAFNAIRGKDLSVVDGWAFMEILKMVRARHSPHKIDNFLDGAAYAALAGEEALNSQK